MTANVLSSELTSLIQESRRRHSDLRNASEKALQDLKALPVTSETQLAADLQRRPHFIDAFLSACRTRNSKLAIHAVNSLQRLVIVRGIAKDRIKDVLEAFLECSTIGLDVQLKILQALPPFLQSYSEDIQGDLLSLSFQVCSVLQQAKASAVSSTASATFQQLVSFVFEKVITEDDRNDNDAHDLIEVPGLHGPIRVRPGAADAYKLFADLCLLMDGQKPQFVRNAQLSQTFGLELIATLLTDYSATFKHHTEQIHILRERLMPLITRLLSERPNFPISLRTIRIFCIILRDHLKQLAADCEIALGLLNHLLEPDVTAPWRRAICMEAFRIIYTTPHLAVELFLRFDENPNRKNIIQSNLGAFVRLASEKPSLIGLAQQSSYPVGPTSLKDSSQEQALLEAGGIAGVISHDVGVREVNVSGISTQWSSLKVPCLELMDKSEPPVIPETYSYSLVLTCISSLSEALARTVLPLVASNDSPVGSHSDEVLDQDAKSPTVLDVDALKASEGQHGTSKSSKHKRTKSGGPNQSNTSQKNPKLRTITTLIDECWPAVLATCSTFLYASLDADFYRSLIRSFQYFTQVSGLLRLSTPRDAFLTTLAKSAVPSNVFKSEIVSTPVSATETSQNPFNVRNNLGSDQAGSVTAGDSHDRSRRGSLDLSKPSLTPRNLMCMRALVNLAIALGPTMEQSWSIILDTLQKADLVLAASGTMARARDYRSGVQNSDRQETDSTDPGQATLGIEISAVETAVTRLFQSTEDYPNEAFVILLGAFCNLISGGSRKDDHQPTSNPPSPLSQRRGMFWMSMTTNAPPQHYQLAISKIGEVTRINLPRFAQYGPDESGWTILMQELLTAATAANLHASARAMAVDVVGNASVGVAIEASSENPESRGIIQRRALSALQLLIEALYRSDRMAELITSIDLDVHKTVLDSLRALLEQCGEALLDGWDIILNIINSPFHQAKWETGSDESDSESNASQQAPHTISVSPKLSRSAFASAQLICSDFLASLSHRSTLTLTEILSRFCSQQEDLNIALTTITLFWNVSDFLQHRLADFTLPADIQETDSTTKLAETLVKSAEKGSATALWMLLLLRLSSLTNDRRPDVRNGAIHTVLRVVDNCADQLSPQIWQHCIRNIFFGMIELNVKSLMTIRSQENMTYANEDDALIFTTKIILEGVADTFHAYIDKIAQIDAFEELWRTLLSHFKAYNNCQSYELSEIVFKALSHVLSAAKNTQNIGASMVASAASLWAERIPNTRSDKSAAKASNGEKAFVAYVESIQHIYRLMKTDINSKHTKLILDNLYSCIIASTPAAYSSDIEKMTDLQVQVLETCSILRTDISGIPSMIISLLSSFIVLPYQDESESTGTQELTFIAFAKSASEQLQSFILAHINHTEIYQSGSFATGIAALSKAIGLKYIWKLQGSDPAMWKKATSSAVTIFEDALPAIRKQQLEPSKQAEIWSAVVHLASGISNTDLNELPENKNLLIDEAFDLEFLLRLRNLMFPSLHSSALAFGIHKDLVLAYFEASLMHNYGHYGHSMIPSLPAESPLKGLYDNRFGRTVEPLFNPRLRMSYFCLDELFSLVSTRANHASDAPEADNFNLAKVGFTHLILRCALPLKMYIADQPLRGRLPTPTSQRLELLYILKKLRELNCQPEAVPEWTEEIQEILGGADSGLRAHVRVLDPQKRHLEWLLPLVSSAMKWAARDAELEEALRGTLDVVFKAPSKYA